MDPNQWNYSRLPAAASVPSVASLQPLLEQQGLAGAAGLALSPPLPAHAVATAPRVLSPYGHPLPAAVSQILDTMTLSQSLVAQAQHRSPPVAQPTAFTIDQSVRTSAGEQTLARNLATSTSPSLTHPPSASTGKAGGVVYTVETREALVAGSTASAQNPTAAAATDSQRWNLSSYIQPSSSTLYAEHTSSSIQEPPPAHSGARPSTIQKHPYLPKTNYDNASSVLAARGPTRDPQPAHSHTTSLTSRVVPEDLELTRALQQQQHQQQQQQQQQQQHQRYQEQVNHYKEVSASNINARSSYSEASPSSSHHSSYTGSPQVVTQSYTNSQQLHQPAVTTVHQQTPYSTYSVGSTTKTYSQSQATRASSDCMKYEAVSPVPEPISTTETHTTYRQNMALQDLADISSSQEKMPLASVGNSRHQQHILTSLQQQQQQQQQSPVQTTPSPQQQVSSLSLGSPQGHVAPSSTVQPPQMPVQAVADSTTKRGRKSSGGKRGGGGPGGGGGAGSKRRKNSVPVQHTQTQVVTEAQQAQLTQIQVPQPIVSSLPISIGYPATMVHNPNGATVTVASANGYETISSQDLASTISTASYAANNPEQQYENQLRVSQDALSTETHILAVKEDCGSEEQPVFMTNTLGNAFVNPNDVLQQVTPVQSEEDAGSQSSIDMDYNSYVRMKHRTKAMQKQMPVLAKEEVDEEFAHLVADPVVHAKASEDVNSVGQVSFNPHNPGFHNPGNAQHNPGNLHKPEKLAGNPHVLGNSHEQLKPSMPLAGGNKTSGFQGSFLSFLQGKKPETLSSVTNTTLIKKPELPKYVPDPRPRRVEQRPEPRRTESSDEEEGSMASVSSQERDSKTSHLKKSTNAPTHGMPVDFSDDDSSSQGGIGASKSLTKTVQSVITNLGTEEAPRRGRGKGRGQHPTARRGRGRGRGASSIGRLPPILPYREGDIEEIEISESDDDDDDMFMSGEPSPKVAINPVKGRGRGRGRGGGGASSSKKKERSPSPVVPRERSTRKAKEKVEKKRMEKLKKKTKRSKKSIGDSDSESDSKESDFLELSSSSEHEAAYDSDKDPGWNPFGDTLQERRLSSGSEEDRPAGVRRMSGGRGFHRGRKSPLGSPGRPSGRGRGSRTASTSSVGPGENDLITSTPHPPPPSLSSSTSLVTSSAALTNNTALWDIPDDGEEAHNYPKGGFVIDRRDLTKHKSYPIWRIDAGRLLQKYEPVFQDGEMRHKALSTYSSWSENIRKSHKAIAVRPLAGGRVHDVVEVIDKYRPKAPEDKLEEDELMPSFNVYIQTLVSQALEPTFLAAIHGENDEYYIGPLKAVDEMLANRLQLIAEQVTWLDNFKTCLNTYPSLTIAARFNSLDHCQATGLADVPARWAVTLRGLPYNSNTLDTISPSDPATQEFLIGEPSNHYAKFHHRLQHFKYNLLKHCQREVQYLKTSSAKTDTSDLLDQCLQNRAWVQMHFRTFKELLETELPLQST